MSSDEDDEEGSVQSEDNAELDDGTGSDSDGNADDLERNRPISERQRRWAQNAAMLYPEGQTREWFLSLPYEQQIRVETPGRTRKPREMFNVHKLRGKDYKEMSTTTAIALRGRHVADG